MMSAAKHFDPVIGVDIHIIQPPGPVPPLPVPHPFIGFILDPMDYIPIVGSTVNINFLPRALAGTQGICMPPHIPIGGMFVKPPANECEMFMGSATVNVDGDAQSYLGLPALSCHCIGMPPIPRLRKKGAVKSLVLPTSSVLPIPAGPPVLIGGPPTISLMAMAMKLGMSTLGAACKKFMKTKLGRAIGKKLDDIKSSLKKKTPSHNKACGRAGEPVDVVTGANVDDFVDFDHPRFPGFAWARFYNSTLCDLEGPLGFGFRHGWQHELRFLKDRIEYRLPDGDIVELPLPEPASGKNKVGTASDVFQSSWGGFHLTGTPNSSWTLSSAYSPTLVFSSPESGVCSLISIATASQTIELEYDKRGRWTSARATDGTVLELDLDASGRIQEVLLVRDSEKHSVAIYHYDPTGCLAQWTDANGNIARYEFDMNRRMIRKIDRNDYAYHYEYDENGRCHHTYGQDGLYDVRFEYFPEECFTVATFADGAQSEYHYDESGALTKIMDANGGVTLFEINASGDVAQQIDPNGDVTKYLYDASGGNVGRIDASGQWLLPFDLQPHRPNGLASPLPALPQGWIAGNATTVSMQQTDAIASQVSRLENAPQSLRKAVEQVGTPVQEFDPLGRAIEQRPIATRGHIARSFDPNGNIISEVDEDGSRWSYRYHSWNLLKEKRNPIGSSVRFETNLREAITTVIDGGNTETQYELDPCDRLISVSRGGQLRERYVYNQNGSLIEKFDCNGERLLKMEPGPYATVASMELKEGPCIQYVRDELARVIAANDGKCQLLRKYSPNGRLVADKINGLGVGRKPTSANKLRVELLEQFTIDYDSQSDGSIVLTDPTGQRHTLRRDSVGRFAVESSNGTKQWMAFDHRGHLLSQYIGGIANGDWWRSYEYSPAGNLQKVSDSRAGKTEYRYDAAHRLTAHIDKRGHEQSFAYDQADNLLVQPGLSGVKVGNANQLERTAEEQFEYNARMHMSTRNHVDGTTTYYTYDALDRLTTVRRSDGLDWHAQYDPMGRRIAKHWTAPDESKHSVEFYWDDHRLAGEWIDRKRMRLYIYADDAALTPILIADYDSPTAKPESGRLYHVIHDQRGQPTDVLDTAGRSVWKSTSSPYGLIEVSEPTDFDLSLRMPGHYEDVEAKLFYTRHRYYDPRIGRFIQTDPIGLAGGLNVFGYSCNPLTIVDLEGLHPSGATADSPTLPKESPPTSAKPKPAPPPPFHGVPQIKGKTVNEIRECLKEAGFRKVPKLKHEASGKSELWHRRNAAGDWERVRIDAAGHDGIPSHYAGAKPHAHKEVVPGGQHPDLNNKNSTKFNDDNAPDTAPEKVHIPIEP